MSENQTIAVYCASSAKVNPVYLHAARKLGKILAQKNVHCIYGAGHAGLMGALADAVIEAKGEITGVIPQFMIENDWHHKQLKNLLITNTMHERKALMAKMSDAAIALPGGCGTLEELLEVITWKQLNLYTKPIIIINIEGYFDPLIEMLHRAIEEKFMRAEHSQLWELVQNPDEIFDAINRAPNLNQNGNNFAVV